MQLVHPHTLDDSIFTETRQYLMKDLMWKRTIVEERVKKANRCLHYLMRHQPHHKEV